MYCEDCNLEVEHLIVWDWYGDPSVPGGVCEFQHWYCSECGGENLREGEETSSGPIPLETGPLPEGQWNQGTR